MSQQESLKDTLLEELSCLDVFLRLVRYSPARSKLLRIVASLMASNKLLASRLAEAFVSRYSVQPDQDDTDQEQNEDSGSGSKLDCWKPEYSRMHIYDGEDSPSASASASGSATNEFVIPSEEETQVPPTELNVIVPNNALEELPAEELQAIDLGLRLGSFLSEAGWMQESISVLSCLNARLKHLPRHKHWLVMRLDCLQR